MYNYVAAANGALILSCYNVTSTSYYYRSVRVYYNGGVIFVMIIIIIQLKLTSFVISWDTLELQATQELDLSGMYWPLNFIYKYCFYSYGTDFLSMKWDDVNCASSSYLSIAQCSYSTYIDSGCTNSNSYDATVYCCKI